MLRLALVCALITFAACANILAGVATVDGVPLAGYNHGDRRVKKWPIPTFTKYTTFMTPSIGVAMPLWAKCLALSDSNTTFVMATIDAIGADGGLFQEALKIARDQGYKTSVDNTILSASHSHSGPGGVSSELLWELAPATDMIKPALRTQMASSIASCLIEAELNLRPARMGLGTGQVTTASHNRRAHFSPYVTPSSIDPQLGVIRVDDVNGKNIANLWNFAIHGTCLGEENMYMHGDIMGVTNQLLEQETGVPALFVNSDAGDIAPSGCEQWKGSRILADAIKATSASITTLADAEFHVVSKIVPFGPTNMNLTLHRLNNCTSGGHIDLCSVCSQKVLDCHANLHLDNNWIEDMPKFTAIRVKQNNKNTLIVTAPGEAINELGNQIKADAKAMNFDQTFLFGYSNNHMVGGYESIMTFWGYNTSHIVREGCSTVANLVKP